MGNFGRLALSMVGYVVGSYFGPAGSFVGYFAGSMLGSWMFPVKGGGLNLPDNSHSSRVLINGFSQTSLTTQVPVPIVFGKVLLHGNFLSAILLGEGNRRMVATIGLGEGTLSLYQVYFGGKEFNKLPNYAASRGDEKNTSWVEFYDNGQTSQISIYNTGKKESAVRLM